jgi:hypothetical protein
MKIAKRRFNYYDDLATVHVENGYLIFLLLLILVYDGFLLAFGLFQPPMDNYLVPGVKGVQEVKVHWSHAYGDPEAVAKLKFNPVQTQVPEPVSPDKSPEKVGEKGGPAESAPAKQAGQSTPQDATNAR